MKKDTILLVWQYSRKDWVEIFLRLSNDFNFVFLAEVFKTQPIDNVSSFAEVIYWEDYSNAFEILSIINPQKIIFMGLESLHTIALNYAAKKRNVGTFFLQHGIEAPVNYYINFYKSHSLLNSKEAFKSKSLLWFMLSFYVSTFKLNIGSTKYLLKYIYFKKKLNVFEFLSAHPYKYRIADRYLVFTAQNALMFSQRDCFPISKYIEIGNPNLDKYYIEYSVNSNYLLLIDIPLVEIIAEGLVEKKQRTAESLNKFYCLINEYALENKLRLKIKLHPYNYESTFYYKHGNIDYIKDCDIPNLINGAESIVSFLSTLTLPAILKKPFLLVRTSEDEQLLNDFENWGGKTFPSLDTFSADDIDFMKISENEVLKENLYKEYIFKFDGQSLQRLKDILMKQFR